MSALLYISCLARVLPYRASFPDIRHRLYSDANSTPQIIDLRDPSITPLNFTKSINLALSERGLNAMRYAGHEKLLQHVVSTTIPMRGRMIHGKRPDGKFYEAAQDYDVHGRV